MLISIKTYKLLQSHWIDALEKCRSRGLKWDLISINSESKAVEIDQYLKSINAGNIINAHIWTSGHRRANIIEQNYLWLNGLEIVASSNRWAEGHPMSYGRAVHSNIALKKNSNGDKWLWTSILDDSGLNYFLCEQKSC